MKGDGDIIERERVLYATPKDTVRFMRRLSENNRERLLPPSGGRGGRQQGRTHGNTRVSGIGSEVEAEASV